MSRTRDVVEYVWGELDGPGDELYTKSKYIGEAIELGAREVGQVFAELDCEAVGLGVEKWSRSAGATTWRIWVEDEEQASLYVNGQHNDLGPRLAD